MIQSEERRHSLFTQKEEMLRVETFVAYNGGAPAGERELISVVIPSYSARM